MRHLVGLVAFGLGVGAVGCGDDTAASGAGGAGGAGTTSAEASSSSGAPPSATSSASTAQASSTAQGSGGEGAGGEGNGGGADCTEITATDGGPTARLFIRLDTDVELDDTEVGDAIAVADFGPDTGTFDLAEEPSIADALHVIVLVADVSNDELDGSRYFFQASGTMTIDTPPDPDSQYYYGFAGSVDDVTLREATIEDDGTTTFVEGGECFHLAHADFDATGYGSACEAPTDLAAPSGGACEVGEESSCNPVTNDGCGPTETCDFNGTAFGCFPTSKGDAAICEACSNVEPATFCVAGQTCSGGTGEGVCHRYCCTDEDCGEDGLCIHGNFAGDVGVCIVPD